MILKNLIFCCVILFPVFSYSQEKYIHPTTIQIFYSISDFNNSGVFSNFSKGYDGLGVAFTKGINLRFDWYIEANFLYGDSIMKKSHAVPSNQLLVESDIGLRYRILNPNVFVQPFALAGGGVSTFNTYWSAYLYPGLGLQFNFSTEFFGLLGMQRRFGLTSTLSHHYFYSIGLAGNIRKRKSVKQKAVTPEKIVALKVADRDNDGIVDSVDVCPDIPGLAIYKGCPDSDQDGIADNSDKCPTVPGFAKYHGCPVPDTDKDGVNDEEDSCINVVGIRELHGCPAVKKELKEVVDLVAKNIFFETGSSRLLPNSFPALDTLSAILNRNPKLKLNIEGHTDNVGDSISNQVLSEERCKSISEYLVQKGIEGSRLTAVGFGEGRPIADNKTEKGRAENRRVELGLGW